MVRVFDYLSYSNLWLFFFSGEVSYLVCSLGFREVILLEVAFLSGKEK